MLRITRGKGFQIFFDNGWGVSVQFGPGNYCEHYDDSMLELLEGKQKWRHESIDAETALIDPKGNLIPYGEDNGDTVQYRRTPEQVLELLNYAHNQT